MELSKNFEPKSVEQKWNQHWLSKKYFSSKPDNRPAYTVVIPPPNVTGVLHMGHTLNETVQDILVRKARMSGFNACWVPGSDHASIATESKVVQMLDKEKGIKKADLTREEFLKYAFEWKEKYGNIIYSQIEKLGCSVDWDRVNFTMDDHYYKAVMKVFVDLYNKGLIYRGARMINWDPKAKTALSDEEVEYKDLQGKLYYVKYKVEGSDEFIAIATQRPETIMGDTAVCVNPTDERYAHLKGKRVIVPLVNRPVNIIFDEYVDKEFGTGALKVTPAHDINDYNLGLKHNLEVIDTLNDDGTLSEAAQVFVGLDRFEARKRSVEQLKADGLLIKEEEYTTRLGFSQRNPDTVVEPRISTQWFLKMKEMAGPALKAVVEGDIKIHPGDRFLATYKYWLENVKDWCISRQLWWGQQIPAWYDANGNCYVAETREEAFHKWSIANGQSSEDSNIHNSQFTIDDLVQDEDVLDTWFSSWLWPMEVFHGITNPGNEDINYYYPTAVLVTGQDIIFFWVARMIMAGLEYNKEKPLENAVPFKDVYFTGMVRDKLGRKMSKQLGNSPDLLDLIDKYGADAVRFGIMISSPAGNDLLFDEGSLEQGRNFNNKIWNALKLVKMWEGRKAPTTNNNQSSSTFNFAVSWFENRLDEASAEVDDLMKQFRLSEALKIVYSLIWDDFCSWYLEWVKPGFEQPIAADVYDKTVEYFDKLLQLLHPFMPFVTEEIYHQLKDREDDICVKQFEKNDYKIDLRIIKTGKMLGESITVIRDARKKFELKNAEKIQMNVDTNSLMLFKEMGALILLEKMTNTFITDRLDMHNEIIVTTKLDNKFYLQINKGIDKESLKEELLKDLDYQQKFLESVIRKLSNERFVQNAKPEIVDLERKKQADAEARIKTIEESLQTLS